MAYERKTETKTSEAPRRVRAAGDAFVKVEIQSSEGTITRTLCIAGFTHNSLPWERKGTALDEKLLKAFSTLGNVSFVE